MSVIIVCTTGSGCTCGAPASTPAGMHHCDCPVHPGWCGHPTCRPCVEHGKIRAPTRRCGRLTPHPPHEWSRPRVPLGQSRETFHCEGAPVTEGGWTRCGACGTSGPPHDDDGVECRETAREKAISQGDV